MKQVLYVLVPALLVAAAGAVLAASGCSGAPKARAMRIQDRAQIVGGLRSLGDVNDYLLQNGTVRAVVQDIGYSRGFGVFGGSLIDLDLERPAKAKSSMKAVGFDGLSEIFPAFFLQAVEPHKIEIVNDGTDGNAAVVRVSGKGAAFMTVTTAVNKLLLNDNELEYTVDYILEPGVGWLTIRVTATNPKDYTYSFPVDSLPLPVGFIALMGAGQRLFVPGPAGYDARFTIDRVYKQPWKLPAIGGLVAPLWITEGEGVSYGMMPLDRNAYVFQSAAQYGMTRADAPEQMFIPLVSDSFMGAFVSAPPKELSAKKDCPAAKPDCNSFSYAVNMLVGTGDAASVHEVWYAALQKAGKPSAKGHIGGFVLEQKSFKPLVGAWVLVKDARGFVTSARVGPGGRFSAPVPPGTYEAIAVASRRDPVRVAGIEVAEGAGAEANFQMPELGFIAVTTTDETGRLLPTKITVEGIYGPENAGKDPQSFLFDLALGQAWRTTDFEPDDPSRPETRRYLEGVAMAPSGRGVVEVRPGHYTVFVSRGAEYTLASKEVDIGPGEVVKVQATLARAIDASGYVSADFHVHSSNSIDSGIDLRTRVSSYAAEGVDYIASTDHNFLTDITPTVAALGLTDWVKASVGIELTTLELGHFNAWPLAFEPGPITHGSFEWFQVPTSDYVTPEGIAKPGLFNRLRQMGTHGPDQTIVQVNHPRDSIMGYFTVFGMDEEGNPTDRSKDMLGPKGPAFQVDAFSFAFDALEIFNGKRLDLLHDFRVPDPVPPPPYPPHIPNPQPGDLVKDPKDKVAFPGAVDDWMHLLEKGMAFTATGNSDSHGLSGEVGCPRNFVRVGGRPEVMFAFDEQMVTRAVLDHAVIVSNGPLLEMWAGQDAVPVGGRVTAPTAKVTLRVRAQAAPWVDVTQVRIYRGGTRRADGTVPPVKVFDVPASQEAVRLDETVELDVPKSTWFVAEAVGKRDLWPVMTPYDVPPVLLTDAVGTIADQIPGILTRYYGLEPSRVQQAKPYALTNPIWVDRTIGRSLRPPVAAEAPRRLPTATEPESSKPHRTIDLWRLFGQLRGE